MEAAGVILIKKKYLYRIHCKDEGLITMIEGLIMTKV